MKKVIITGATGMIGLNLINYLLNKDIEITAIVRPNSKRNNILPNNTNLKIVECDLADIQNANIAKDNYDVLFHLAWVGTTGESRNNVDMQFKNIEYTLNTIKLAEKVGARKIVGAGSQAEYGRVEGKLSPNTKTNPETAYGTAKLCAGHMGKILAEQLGIDFVWTRILSIYGEYDNTGTMVMSSIISMINGQVPKYTKAEQIWDYLYVGDVSKAMYLIGEKAKHGQVYCIGSGTVKPLYEYINIIKNEINSELKIKFGDIPYAKNQVMHLCADISDLTKDTGFNPEISFEEGIRRTIKWYKENIQNEKN